MYFIKLLEINGLENKNKVKNDKNKRKFLSLINLDFFKIIEIANKIITKNKGEVIKGMILCKYIIKQNLHLFRLRMGPPMNLQIFCISMKQYNLQTQYFLQKKIS